MTMTAQEILKQLKAWGTPKMREYNISQGAAENSFGVNLSQVRDLAKKIKTSDNHALGLELWATGNAEAMLLAILLLKPKLLSADDLDTMMQAVGYFKIADWLTSYVVLKTKHVAELSERWKDSKKDAVGRAGWALMADRVKDDVSLIEPTLKQIESELKGTTRRKQEQMNYCLVCIGIHHEKYRQRAIDLGYKLEVLKDYPVGKGCVSPFAPIWIEYMVNRSRPR